MRKAQPDDVARLAHLLSAQTELSKGRADETVAHAQLCASEAGPPGEAVISLLHKGNVIGTLHVQEMVCVAEGGRSGGALRRHGTGDSVRVQGSGHYGGRAQGANKVRGSGGCLPP